MIDAAHNTPTAVSTIIPQEIEDKIMAVLPKRIADWLRYEANGDTDVVVIFKEWRAGMSEDDILAGLKAIRRQDTMRAYGMRHPQAFPPQALPKAA